MLKTTRTLITASLALILFGGVISPSVVHADSMDNSDSTAVTTKATDTKNNVKISSVELPYVLVSSKEGNAKLYAFPNAPKTLTAEQINDSDYMDKLMADYNMPDNTIQNLKDSLNSFDGLDPNMSIMDAMSSEEEGVTSEQAIQFASDSYYWQAWIISQIAQEKTGRIDYDTVKANYQKELRPLLTSEAMSPMLPTMDKLFNSNETNYNGLKDAYYGMFTSQNKLDNYYKTEELANLDPDATRRQIISIYHKPLSYLLNKQSDGTYQLSGLLPEIVAYSFWFEDTPDPTPTPTPDPTPATSQPVTVHYVDDQGNTLKADKVLTGKLGDNYQTTPLDINGYAVTKTTGEETGTFGSTAKSVTYTYSAVLSNGGAAATIAPKGTVVYATKKIGLYKKATFTKKARKQWYAKQKRINRPMFVVTGYAKSQNGVKRYRVKDVNHHSKTDGMTGYITANAKYTQRVYYAAKHKKVTVINPKGVNAYGKKNLTNKKAHYKRGQVLKVKKIVNHNLTTRFVLSNGTYVTANKRLVKALN
ncbi:DUF5776 domain-containing protein [Levilactobacillus tujiorum]|uniref:MucBP domain-containing protein n=1 Tax=Levilactobacillus tujiorum TaxID=2912243 RepID=A0ABX1L498_9LACO|nr:DUF5776 domain-containing protein [Levilactobacillus tujiorum]MCH5464108.1 DUF5776 domain-containing protein [Levilactobacillus tujiorum]NLR11207.1 MucBP domain-containing protein [Lactobacillus sp. HBUAS51387]NLR29166.1 MucBP domain-containing protein [Levilactobacillus tujiorum]